MQEQNSTTLHETTRRTTNWKTSLAVPEITCLHHRLLNSFSSSYSSAYSTSSTRSHGDSEIAPCDA
jgi:hypothetical protein